MSILFLKIVIQLFILEGHSSENKLFIESSYKIEATEMSGICLREREVVIVNDKDNLISFYKLSDLSAPASRIIDLKALKGAPSDLNGQWEAVACSVGGGLVLLQETPSRIVVVSKDLKSISSVHDLILEAPLLKNIKWDKASNSLGEGIVLGAEGRFIIAKEKNPVQLIEFSQERIKKGASFIIGKEFQTPKAGSFFAVNNWTLPLKYLKKIKDVSDIYQHIDGSLYLLSDQSRNISKIKGAPHENGGELIIEKTWTLPSRIKKPEGFFLDHKNRAVIVVDSKKVRKKGNLFITSPLY